MQKKFLFSLSAFLSLSCNRLNESTTLHGGPTGSSPETSGLDNNSTICSELHTLKLSRQGLYSWYDRLLCEFKNEDHINNALLDIISFIENNKIPFFVDKKKNEEANRIALTKACNIWREGKRIFSGNETNKVKPAQKIINDAIFRSLPKRYKTDLITDLVLYNHNQIVKILSQVNVGHKSLICDRIDEINTQLRDSKYSNFHLMSITNNFSVKKNGCKKKIRDMLQEHIAYSEMMVNLAMCSGSPSALKEVLDRIYLTGEEMIQYLLCTNSLLGKHLLGTPILEFIRKQINKCLPTHESGTCGNKSINPVFEYLITSGNAACVKVLLENLKERITENERILIPDSAWDTAVSLDQKEILTLFVEHDQRLSYTSLLNRLLEYEDFSTCLDWFKNGVIKQEELLNKTEDSWNITAGLSCLLRKYATISHDSDTHKVDLLLKILEIVFDIYNDHGRGLGALSFPNTFVYLIGSDQYYQYYKNTINHKVIHKILSVISPYLGSYEVDLLKDSAWFKTHGLPETRELFKKMNGN